MAYLDTIIRKGTEYEIRDTDAQNKITQITDDMIAVSDTQPSGDSNKVWIKETTSEVDVPTMAEHNALADDVSELDTRLDELANGALGFVTPEMFGAKGDGITDDITALQNAVDFGFEKGLAVILSGKNYLISKPIILWCRNSHAPVRKDFLGGTKLVGQGIGKTYITKSSTAVSGITGQSINCIIQAVDYRYQDSEFSADDANTACYNVEISGISLQNTASDIATPTITVGIFSVGWFFSLFKDISIVGCQVGLQTRKWNCETKYYNIDISYADKGFDFAVSPNGSGGQTTLLFENCHTNGCRIYGYALAAKVTLINCAQDGGTATFIKGASSPVLLDRQGINATVINCHCESLIANGLIDIEDGHVEVIGGYYELPDNNSSTIFTVRRQASLNIRNAYIISRTNKTNISNTLYSLSAFGTIHFYDCYLNNSIFNSPQPLRNKKMVLFDCGVNNIENVIASNADDGTISTLIDKTIDIHINSSGADRSVWIYLGEINTDEYSVLRVVMDGEFSNGIGDCRLLYAESIDSSGKPASFTTANMGLNVTYNEINISYATTPTVTKNGLIGSKINSVGKKHLFIRFYSAYKIDMSVYKIWLE